MSLHQHIPEQTTDRNLASTDLGRALTLLKNITYTAVPLRSDTETTYKVYFDDDIVLSLIVQSLRNRIIALIDGLPLTFCDLGCKFNRVSIATVLLNIGMGYDAARETGITTLVDGPIIHSWIDENLEVRLRTTNFDEAFNGISSKREDLTDVTDISGAKVYRIESTYLHTDGIWRIVDIHRQGNISPIAQTVLHYPEIPSCNPFRYNGKGSIDVYSYWGYGINTLPYDDDRFGSEFSLRDGEKFLDIYPVKGISFVPNASEPESL